MKGGNSKVGGYLPALRDLIYLDSASVCPPLPGTLQAMQDYYERYPFNYRVGVWSSSVELTELVDNIRKDIAEFIGASSENQVAFTKNTTEAINIVALGMRWRKGDEVVLTTVEHQSNIIPWMKAAEDFGVVVKFAKADSSGIVHPVSVERLISKRTKLVSITEVSNIYGSIQPVSAIQKIAEEHGVLLMTDAAQSAGRLRVDVAASDCTFSAFCGRKSLMGPQGTGFLYGKAEALEELSPLTVGSLAADVKSTKTFSYLDLPYRFEAGVINTAGIVGLGAAVRSLAEIGIGNIRQKVVSLTRYLVERLKEIRGIEIYGPTDPELQAGILSWNMRRLSPDEIVSRLWKSRRIAVASGDQGSPLAIQPLHITGVVRTSVHYFNSREDIDSLATVLKSIRDR